MKVQSLVNAYYQHLDYYFSIVRALQNTENFRHLLFTKSLLKVCNDQATTVWSCCFGFFNVNFELTRVRYCYIFWSGSSYVKTLPIANGKEIIVVSLSAVLISFLQNLERILASCNQLYINCLVILLFVETCSKQAIMAISQYCLYFDPVILTCFEHVSSFRRV